MPSRAPCQVGHGCPAPCPRSYHPWYAATKRDTFRQNDHGGLNGAAHMGMAWLAMWAPNLAPRYINRSATQPSALAPRYGIRQAENATYFPKFHHVHLSSFLVIPRHFCTFFALPSRARPPWRATATVAITISAGGIKSSYSQCPRAHLVI